VKLEPIGRLDVGGEVVLNQPAITHVAWGTHEETGAPAVFLVFYDDEGEAVGFAMTPDDAEVIGLRMVEVVRIVRGQKVE